MLKKVTKNDLVDSIYKSTDVNRQTIQIVVDSMLKEIKGALEKGSDIELRGFGTFEIRLRKGRDVARNPKTGEKLSVAPHYVAAFRAGQSLRSNLLNLKPTDNETSNE